MVKSRGRREKEKWKKRKERRGRRERRQIYKEKIEWLEERGATIFHNTPTV
jgi:hypothetical protein